MNDNPGAWLMHCHLIWHADGGMGLQFIEQPDTIDAASYYNTPAFQNECAAYETYQDAGNEGKLPYEAGIKRHLADLQSHGHSHGHRGKKHFKHKRNAM